ncbi:MAG: rhomboid family intramembrane serine protease [Flavobacteriales bacterium]|nr:rhomboid family intramembrane serine protease [Flavobacteriales bacterium]MBT4705242.1 rhomboid family intramembrane serine protease [Flavobacteriales bacterium]MBT5132998.1 rhomboid family intramembrane serine protease [Flavobacteriales bacterium]MBT6131906.1 rhomboid family intramembrane serine protease [Flavobacteriales bacterium]MBT6383989.1 rhomboid family intramembrane serine protease [Flavobacteriales bacterium]
MLWLIHFLNSQFLIDFRGFGLRPRSIEGLIGLITYPLLHADWKHLMDNSVSAFVLMFGLFTVYGRLGWAVIGWSWLMSGIWIWIAARDGNHIGYSGIIYALASFIFFSGVFRKYYRLMALSLIVVFLYGSMVWGILPIQPSISWEGHLFGAIAGLILAYYYRGDGPQRPKYIWELEEELDDEDENPYWITTSTHN